jgi:hypothetical protein
LNISDEYKARFIAKLAKNKVCEKPALFPYNRKKSIRGGRKADEFDVYCMTSIVWKKLAFRPLFIFGQFRYKSLA